jgi:hypothetical protein
MRISGAFEALLAPLACCDEEFLVLPLADQF